MVETGQHSHDKMIWIGIGYDIYSKVTLIFSSLKLCMESLGVGQNVVFSEIWQSIIESKQMYKRHKCKDVCCKHCK